MFCHVLILINLLLIQNPLAGRSECRGGSGNWYTGKHTSLISKELFDKVQEQLSRDRIVRSESKEFAFTKLMKCGLCGSGITADEKFRKLKDGSINRHVYYGCTKSRDIHCKCGYIREQDLIEQLSKLIDKISLDRLGVKEKIECEIERYRKFRRGVLGIKDNDDLKDKATDAKKYAKYLLKEGTVFEKRELLSNLKSKLVLKDKTIQLER